MAAFFSPYRNLAQPWQDDSHMMRLLVLAALVSCSEGALAGGAPRSHPDQDAGRRTQVPNVERQVGPWPAVPYAVPGVGSTLA